MSKFYGRVGYVHTEETAPGVCQEIAIEKLHRGDLIQNLQRPQANGEVNSSITVSNEISIVANPYALENFHSIRYVEYMNSKWAVTSVQVRYPRLILSLGGIYNGPVETQSPDQTD